MRVAAMTDRAHREGGFLGLGGTEISEHEQAALDEIADVRLLHEAEHVDVEAECVVELRHGEGRGHGCGGGRA
jgi:hypothetical protein